MDHTMLFYKVLCSVPAKPVKFSRQHGDGACTVLWGFHGSASSANVCCEKVTGVVRSLPLPLSPPPLPPMDYGPALVQAVHESAKTAGPWQASAAASTEVAVRARAAAGWINAEDATAIVLTMPPFFAQGLAPLTNVVTATPPLTNLAPVLSEGIKSWYWHLGSFANTGVVVLFTATMVSTSRSIAAWCLSVGAIDGTSGVWVPQPPIYYAPSEVQIINGNGRAGVVFANARAAGTVIIDATTGKTFSVAVVVHDTGFVYESTANSLRGPTFEQSSGSVETVAGIVQTGYWSIVDGVLASATLRVSTATAPIAATTGWSWLDYQQLGQTEIPGGLRFLQALGTPSTQVGYQWLWAAIQTPARQLAFRFVTPEAVAVLSSGGCAAQGNVNIWDVGKPPRYGVPATAVVVARYPGTGVPSRVMLAVSGGDGDGDVYELTSLSTTPASLPGLLPGWESPSTVAVNGVASPASRGTIEWTMPTDRAPVALKAGMTGTYLSNTSSPDAAAVATLVVPIVVVVAVILGVAVGLQVRRPASGAATAPAAKRK